jgi:hypothetical protein
MLRHDRRRLTDLETPRKVQRAAYLFVAAMLVVGGAIGALILAGENSWAAPAATLLLFAGFLVLAASIVNLLFRFLTLKFSYRCPECGGRPTRVPEALPGVHFYCAGCNAEWDTGLVERIEG